MYMSTIEQCSSTTAEMSLAHIHNSTNNKNNNNYTLKAITKFLMTRLTLHIKYKKTNILHMPAKTCIHRRALVHASERQNIIVHHGFLYGSVLDEDDEQVDERNVPTPSQQAQQQQPPLPLCTGLALKV